MTDDLSAVPITCPRCGVGHLLATRLTYIHLYDNTLIHAPNTAAWRCDVCGLTVFDPDAVRRIDVLAGEAGPPPNFHAPGVAHPASADTPAPDDPPDPVQPTPRG